MLGIDWLVFGFIVGIIFGFVLPYIIVELKEIFKDIKLNKDIPYQYQKMIEPIIDLQLTTRIKEIQVTQEMYNYIIEDEESYTKNNNDITLFSTPIVINNKLKKPYKIIWIERGNYKCKMN